MHTEPKRVTARRVRPLFFKLLRAVPEESLSALRRSMHDGRSFDGKRNDTCVYGNLAKGAGYDFVDKTPDEIAEALREFGRSIGYEIRANGVLDEIEQFCAQVGRGDSVFTSEPLWHIEGWRNFVAFERGLEHPRILENALISAGEAVGA